MQKKKTDLASYAAGSFNLALACRIYVYVWKLLYFERNVRRAVVILLLYRIKLILMFFGCEIFKVVLLSTIYRDHDWPAGDLLLPGYF